MHCGIAKTTRLHCFVRLLCLPTFMSAKTSRWQSCKSEPATDRRTTTSAASIHAQGMLRSKAITENGQYWSVEDVAQVVREQYGVEYKSRASYINLLGLCSFSYQKTEKAVRQKWLILKNSSKKTNRRGSRCAEHCFLD